MPKLYEYLGIIVFFYSNEHEPIHVHAQYKEYESKAEIYLKNGEITEIKIKSVSGRKPLKVKQLNNFKKILKKYAQDIVKKWIDYFVYHNNIKITKIKTRIK